MDRDVSIIGNDFNIGDIVYLRHDIDCLFRMVIGINIGRFQVLYELISGVVVSNHFGFEISKETNN